MEKAEEYFQAGLSSYKKGEHQQAIASWKQCLSHDPLHSKAIYHLAQAEQELEKKQNLDNLSLTAQQLFAEHNYQSALVSWFKILELDPNNVFAKTYLDQTKEMYQTAKTKGELVEEDKSEEYFKEGLQAFREKRFSDAAVYWDVVLIIDPANDQARQGLNKARSALIQSKEDAEQEKQTKMNSLLQEGLDLYGAGQVFEALNKWKQILELDLDNKDAMDYIVVAKADLSEEDFQKLKSPAAPTAAPPKAAKVTSETQKLAYPADEEPDEISFDESADFLDDDFEEQATDRTSIPPEFEAEPEAPPQELEEPDEIPFDHDESFDDDFIEPDSLEPDFSADSADDQQPEPPPDLDDEIIDELDDDFGDEEVSAPPEQPPDAGTPDFDDLELPEEEPEEEYELDEEFIEEEDEEEALAAEMDSVAGKEKDAESVKNLVAKYFDRGMGLYKSRQYEEAIIEWKKIFDIDKNNEKAKEYIQKAITLYEASPFIEEHLALGQECLDKEQYEDAIKEFEKILEIDPELDDALAGIEKAKAKLTEVVIPARKAKTAVAKEAKVAPTLAPAKKGFDITPFLQPKLMAIIGVSLVVLIAVGYFLVLRPLQAKKQAEQAKIAKEQAQATQKRRIATLVSDANMQMSMRQYDKAESTWASVLNIDSEHEGAKKGIDEARKKKAVFQLLKRGDNLLTEKEFDEALKVYHKAQKLDPENTLILSKIKETKDANRIYLDAKARVNEILAKGHASFKEGDYNGAIAYYRKALKLMPDDKDAKNAIKRVEFEKRRGINVEANLKLGLQRYAARKYDQAKIYFYKVLELDPDNKDAKFYLNKIDEEEAIM